MIWDPIIEYFTRATGAVAVLAATFWKGDDVISSEASKWLAARIGERIKTPSHEDARNLSDIVSAYFSGRLPAWRFIRNVFLFTIVSMLVLMLVYVPLTPGFFSSLSTEQLQRSIVFSQFLFEGLLATFVANYVGFSIFAARSSRDDFDPFKSLFVDVVAKILVYIMVTALIYVAYARIKGSFTGSDRAALEAVGPTIVGAAKFQNLSAVYLYSVCISSLPLYLVALARAMADYPRFSAAIRSVFFWLPFGDKPIRAIAVVLGVFFAAFAVIASMFAAAIERWH